MGHRHPCVPACYKCCTKMYYRHSLLCIHAITLSECMVSPCSNDLSITHAHPAHPVCSPAATDYIHQTACAVAGPQPPTASTCTSAPTVPCALRASCAGKALGTCMQYANTRISEPPQTSTSDCCISSSVYVGPDSHHLHPTNAPMITAHRQKHPAQCKRTSIQSTVLAALRKHIAVIERGV